MGTVLVHVGGSDASHGTGTASPTPHEGAVTCDAEAAGRIARADALDRGDLGARGVLAALGEAGVLGLGIRLSPSDPHHRTVRARRSDPEEVP